MDLRGVFQHRPGPATLAQIEEYAETNLKPIDDSINVRLPPNDLLEVETTWGDDNKWAMQTSLPAIPTQGPGGKPLKVPRRSGPGNSGLRWSVTNIL